VKVICNVIFNSPLYSKIIDMEGVTHLMFVKRKLERNSHKFDKGVNAINVHIWQTTHFHPCIKVWIHFAFHFQFPNQVLMTPFRIICMEKFPPTQVPTYTSSMNCKFFKELLLVFKMDANFVWNNVCQWTCLGWKMLPPWMPRLSISFSHLKDIFTSMNYWFMNQMSTTCHAPTLSQLVSTQILFV